MNQAINVWGPAFLVCFTVCLTVLIGVITNNNQRIDDLLGEFLSNQQTLRRCQQTDGRSTP